MHPKTPCDTCAYCDVVALYARNTANSIISVGFVCEVTHSHIFTNLLTLSNPIFLPTAYSEALICFSREKGWWITCNYPTVLKEKKTWRSRKSTTCTICWLKSVLHEEKRRTGSDSGRTNAIRTVSDIFRHRSGTGKSY
jgi:hypothetical protein